MPSGRSAAALLVASVVLASCAQTIRPPPEQVYASGTGSVFDELPEARREALELDEAFLIEAQVGRLWLVPEQKRHGLGEAYGVVGAHGSSVPQESQEGGSSLPGRSDGPRMLEPVAPFPRC